MSYEPTNPEEIFVIKRLVWNGILRRKDIEKILRISSDFASRIISNVKIHFSLKPQGKCYVHEGDVPDCASAEIFLEDVRKALITKTDIESVAGTDLPAFIMSGPGQIVDSNVLREIVRAIKEQRSILVDYTGVNLGDVTKKRLIDPVSIMLINDRWHVHAYAHPEYAGSPDFGWRDFVLSRIGRSYGLMDKSNRRLEHSEDMQMITATVVPHPMLTDDQKAMIAQAWGMHQGRLTMSMTKSQFFYFKKQYVAAVGEAPPAKLLFLENASNE
jgi:hypothetical protein